MRRIAASALLAVVLSACAATAAAAHAPILFVHGWKESSSLWTTMIGR
ncbi:MAG: hypothetical protein QOI03_906, partial [Solirubrobacteraceae bacterium]|nr:hypothetical protein [Solirubrobacteraceae bacterium]